MSKSIDVVILLVEDNPRDTELILRALSKASLANHVVHVPDGQEAIDWLFCEGQFADRENRARPRLVLLDLKLPKVDGLEVLRTIRGDDRTRHLPVVVMTSSSEEQDLIESYNLGVNSYVVKPVEFEEFSDAVLKLGHYWLLVNEVPNK